VHHAPGHGDLAAAEIAGDASAASATGSPSGTFLLEGNGITIICGAAAVGDAGTVCSTVYPRRIASRIATANVMTTPTACITNMFALCNADIGHWEASSVIDTNAMFERAAVLNRNLSVWNVCRITSKPGRCG
jgi:hypothetical protein